MKVSELKSLVKNKLTLANAEKWSNQVDQYVFVIDNVLDDIIFINNATEDAAVELVERWFLDLLKGI